ncbi:MAG TPA: 30S ribosomal protein S20 [Bacteroidetes bacterium]|nr:30S ribosomal protein S20 [Bacteroidota bacterium]
MAHHKSAIKRIKKSRMQNMRNRHYRSTMRTYLKKIRQTTNKEEAQALLPMVSGYLDKLAAKGIIHKNNAANKKSKITRYVNSLA